MSKMIWFAFGLCLGVSGCATSPLYEGDPSSGYGTVPRDEMGEPLFDQIEPKPFPTDNDWKSQ